MTIYQILLPIINGLFFAVFFVGWSIFLYFKAGKNPIVFSKADTPINYIGKVYRFLTLCTWISILCFAFFPRLYVYFQNIDWLKNELLQNIGLILLVLGFICCAIAQLQMSKSWRVGIDENEKTELVRDGIFKYSRNPFFLGVLISCAGTFLVMPNAVMLAILLATYIIMQIQIRLEEAYLEKQHAAAYLSFRADVRRWI